MGVWYGFDTVSILILNVLFKNGLISRFVVNKLLCSSNLRHIDHG